VFVLLKPFSTAQFWSRSVFGLFFISSFANMCPNGRR
jgi:hypothetical protein